MAKRRTYKKAPNLYAMRELYGTNDDGTVRTAPVDNQSLEDFLIEIARYAADVRANCRIDGPVKRTRS